MTAPDGYLYAWVNANSGGDWCRWYDNDANWNTCSGSKPNLDMLDKASSLENRGYAGAYEDAGLSTSPNWEGARYCLPDGHYLGNLTGIHLPWDGRPGQGQSVNDNIASHKWSNNC
ncbi:hypothetical protein OG705_04220 [Streptomyces sp. NBC_00838]|uniref:hypothetical protein n=1 Tax=Streptomyces sp. NBC_00838 TaxID=2903680 RepID=UPI003868BE6F|nr:hypothetical protein OG705_04220 [Streptomyces sp. NBC_00838]